MILFLARKYFVNTLVFAAALALIPVLFGSSLIDVLPTAFFLGSTVAVGYTFWRFRKQNVWPLYDNLRLHRLVLFVGLFLGAQLVTLTLSLFL
ncbi:hypothetical protein [Salinibacter altiplanensis]|uniref:hypothetical protein n=1 Tax=Salinibacter altiplanensis TaxID=1803181 RepID=UPI000C9EFA25|nr:hypothetical protein [Salinibacter altiplanensis]